MGTEIQDFAAALAALKERSGLSYGALAKRLHMSTSTVHRYCNGDALPHEFAPVERLARLCRATPDEMVALHRQWILADQAKKQGGARKDQAAPPVPAAPPAPTTPSWARPADAEAESDEDGETEPVAEPIAEPAPTPTPNPTPAPATTSIPGPTPAAPDADELLVTGRQGKPGAPGEPDGPTGPGGRGRPWSRRTRVLLAAAVVIALSVPSVLIARNVAGGSGDGRNTDAVGATATAVRNASPSPSRKPSAKPSASASASASASPSASATAAGPTATAGPAKKGAGAVAPDGVPLRATITSYNWDAPCGQYTLLDDDPNDVPPPPSPQSSRGWAKSLGGVDGGSQLLELTLQGSSSEAVVVSGLHVRVVTRKAPLAWNAFSMADGCGSAITPQSFDIDLDDDQPRTEPVAGQQGDAVVPAQDFPFRTSSTDVQVLNLDAHVEGHDVSWYLELDWTSGDRSGTLRVDDHGEPFRTSSIKARPEYIYWQDRAQWMDKDYSDPSMADEGE
ncbi:helix-turn-helix domain-containing protein [Streptomyces sp. NBC_01335]|uniref:helix-turn-helix domain-containing protein n=1 Tax=Streptomyces sp. NBC_01335 TaxID=2903828 RepID=UPI002E107C76|nr:helix-turn-helix domain-containing protein [Streptomyces sp. NBC_01335]